MLSFIISLVVFVVASYFLNRYLEDWGLDKGKGRTLLVITLASLVSYGSMFLVDKITGSPSLIDSTLQQMTPEQPGTPNDR